MKNVIEFIGSHSVKAVLEHVNSVESCLNEEPIMSNSVLDAKKHMFYPMGRLLKGQRKKESVANMASSYREEKVQYVWVNGKRYRVRNG